MNRYVIIVSRDRPDLWETLAIVYSRQAQVEIRFDRRRGEPWTGTGDRPDRRAATHRDSVLREQGFLAILQPEIVAAARSRGGERRQL